MSLSTSGLTFPSVSVREQSYTKLKVAGVLSWWGMGQERKRGGSQLQSSRLDLVSFRKPLPTDA